MTYTYTKKGDSVERKEMVEEVVELDLAILNVNIAKMEADIIALKEERVKVENALR